MTAAEALRNLTQIRVRHGKRSELYGEAVSAFVARLVDPATGELLGRRALCPACAVASELLDLALRFVDGCALCGDTGLACPGCGNAVWVRSAPAWYAPHDLADNRLPVKLVACPVCASWVGSSEAGGYQQDRLRAIQSLEGYYARD